MVKYMSGLYPLQHHELPEEIRSEYIDTGYVERLRILDVSFDLEKRLASAYVSIETGFANSYGGGKDNSYHWSIFTAYRAVGQLAIGYICTELEIPKKEIGEIVQMSSRINTPGSIRQTENVPVGVEFSKYLKRKNRLLGELRFDVADRRFYGDIRFSVDL